MTVRRMTFDELSTVLEWAALEGWNPGLDDAHAFWAADPQGFFVNIVDQRPVAAISVVNQDDHNAFLGLYICHPDHRGKGYGMDVWNAALKHAGRRCIGLDGVPNQQDNYERSGFSHFGRTIRYRGFSNSSSAASDLATIKAQRLISADAHATGLRRSGFAASWFTDGPTRQTRGFHSHAKAPSFATFRKCRDGVKIGPFHAHTPEQANHILDNVPPDFCQGPLFIDVPDTSRALSALVRTRGFAPVFETARMYSASPPKAHPPEFYAVASLELG